MRLKPVTAIILAILCVFSLVSCAPSNPPTNNQTTTTTTQSYTQPQNSGVVEGTKVFSNVDYTLFVPSSYKADEKTPLLVALHGGGQGTVGDAANNRQFFADYTGLNTVAEKYGFMIAYPRQSTKNNYGSDYWNWFIQQSKTAKEPSAIYAIVGEVKKAYNIDSERVFICGLSAGAAMAQIVAVNYNNTFAGCCCVAGITFKSGDIYQTNELQANGPSISNDLIVSRIYDSMGSGRKIAKLLVITGTADTRVHPNNSLVMAQTWTSTMAKIDPDVDTQLKKETLTGIDNVEYTKSVYATLNGEELCTMYEVIGMEHNWPGSNKGVSISITSGQDLGYKGGIDLNEVMCEYFGLNK